MSSIHAEPPPPIVEEPSGINYATGAALGRGGFAICHRAERYDGSKPTGAVVALKIVKTKMEPVKLMQKFVTEMAIHSKLSHPNIVAFYRAFSLQTSTYVVLELCPNGSLADMLKKRKYITLPEIRRFVIQICGAVKYLHHRHIVHRDLKTGNLFLDENMNVKVGDFGLAALSVTEKEMEVRRRTTMCGTPNYLAPEILEKGKGHSEKVDLWAIGVIAYTLAVGKAPFHANTKEEIYKKVRSSAYTWPELSAMTNQSTDLRNLVSCLLVEEELRPVPDQIVSQPFFKIAFVPSGIPTTAREKAPNWPENTLPSAEVFRRGYSDTWYALCKESGVGEYQPGSSFKLNGGKRIRSIVHDLEREAQMGLQPTMPIGKGVVYVSTVTQWDAPTTISSATTTPDASEEIVQPPAARVLQEIAHNEVSKPRSASAGQRQTRDAELMPPPPPRLTKAGSFRKAARTISEETTAKSAAPVKIASDEPAPSLTLPKVRTTVASAAAKLREIASSSSSSGFQTARSLAISENLPESENIPAEKPTRTASVKRSADASLARRPRANKPKERPKSVDLPGPPASLDELKQALPTKRIVKKKSQPVVVEILSDPESEPASAPSTVPSSAPLALPPPPAMTKRLPVPQKDSSDPNAVSGTDPTAVLDRLSQFRDNLAAALANTYQARSSPAEAENLPFVTRWIDYSRKHGTGYVLSDGTVGCLLKAQPDRGLPLTHCFVRSGLRWLFYVQDNLDLLSEVPLEVLEDHGAQGIRRKVYKGLGSVREGALKEEADRRRVLGVLWVKFGRYMMREAEDPEELAATSTGENFVRFYQRVGSVGMWAYADGCLQVNFPDHTKMVLSPTGTHISATCISPEAATYLSSHADLLQHHVSSRERFDDGVASLLHEGGRVRARIVKANALAEKLTFVLKVVTQWVDNGGLGCMDMDDPAKVGAESLEWCGLSSKESLRRRGDRITVGRPGRDTYCVRKPIGTA